VAGVLEASVCTSTCADISDADFSTKRLRLKPIVESMPLQFRLTPAQGHEMVVRLLVSADSPSNHHRECGVGLSLERHKLLGWRLLGRLASASHHITQQQTLELLHQLCNLSATNCRTCHHIQVSSVCIVPWGLRGRIYIQEWRTERVYM
jgi:hypothetical protein